MKTWRAAALACAVLAGASPGLAQQAIDYASVSGRVTDPSGAPVPGAQVTARHAQTNVTGATATDREGRFRFAFLRVGRYEVVVRQAGFEEVTRELTLTVGSAFNLPVTLAVSGIDASITVSGEAPLLEAARTQVAATVSEPEIGALPLNGRHFLDVALLVAGVAPANVSSTQLFPETSAVPGITLSIGSQRNLSNNFIVDGLSANDDAAALSGMPYGLDAVEQFQVVTSGAHAELGRALGGYVSVVTKSGTNVLHGAVYDYVRDDRLNAKNALSNARLPMNQAQYGGSLGGPIVADRTFYFANVEQRRLDQTGLVTIPPAIAAAINQRLADVSYQGPRVQTGIYPNPVRSSNVFGRLDHQVGGRDQMSVRYGQYDVRAENSRNAGGLSAPSASSGLDNLDQVAAVSNTFTISARTVLESRAQIARGSLAAPPSDALGPAVSIAGAASFGTSSASPTGRVNTLYQVVNNLSRHAGSHALKGGVDLLYNAGRIAFPRAARGSYTFSSLASFLAGTYNNAGFAQTFGASEVSQRNPNVGMYLQDEWKAGAGVTVNLGIRYDLQYLETIDTDTDNVSPRLGIAWLPFASQRTLVRGSVGLFYDRVPLRPLANALLSAGNTDDVDNLRQINVSLSPAQAGAPVFPDILTAAVPSITLPTLTTMDRQLQNAQSRQASLEIEHQVGDRSVVSAGYQYLRGQGLLMAINQNVPTCAASGTNNGCRPDPRYANNNQYSSAGESSYQALHVSFVRRPSDRRHYRVSYTLSKSMSNLGSFFFSSPIDPFDVSKDWARSDDDQRHRLVAEGAMEGWGFQFSGLVQIYSAAPFNMTSGLTTVQGTTGRPIVNGAFIERNAGAGSAFVSLNARISRFLHAGCRVRVELLAEGFNLTNHRNVLTRNSNFGAGAYPTQPAPNFGQATAVGEPRSLQLGARLRF